MRLSVALCTYIGLYTSDYVHTNGSCSIATLLLNTVGSLHRIRTKPPPTSAARPDRCWLKFTLIACTLSITGISTENVCKTTHVRPACSCTEHKCVQHQPRHTVSPSLGHRTHSWDTSRKGLHTPVKVLYPLTSVSHSWRAHIWKLCTTYYTTTMT